MLGEHGDLLCSFWKVACSHTSLGLDREPMRLISVDWAPNDREGDKTLFMFDCGKLGDDEAPIRLPAAELTDGHGSNSATS